MKNTSVNKILMALFTVATLLPSTVSAQKKYISPVDFPLLLAGNVGELRTDAFHAGIDIKGMKGLGSPVFAIADGYVMRIGVSPWGYGNVLYVKNSDGTVYVCAHLHEFAPKIAAWVREQQYAKKSFTVDLYPGASMFPVKQGEKIATVGNTGSSGGAHVHFEIRDARTGMPMNIIKLGYYAIPDKEKPILKSVKLFEIDTINGLEIHRLKETVPPPAEMKFSLRGNGYLVYEVVDYKDGKSNTMGVYSIEQKVDGVINYSFFMDNIDLAKGRYMNAHVHYGEHIASKFDVLRAYVSPNNQLGIYRNVVAKGVVKSGTDPRLVETIITDDAGNQTLVKITIIKDETSDPRTAPLNSKAVKWNNDFAYSSSKLAVNISKGTLYDDAFLDFGEKDGVFTIGSSDIPLHKSAWINVAAPKNAIPDKVGLVIERGDNKISWVGGTYKNGWILTSINRLGNYRVEHDTIPPIITPLALAEKGSSLLRFKISDNLSGISTYILTVDGTWALPELDGKTGTLIHAVKRSQTPKDHSIVLVVTDAKGNKTTYKKTVRW